MMIFSEHVMNAFSKNETTYNEYKALLRDVKNGIEIFDENGNKVPKDEVEKNIRQVQFDILGLSEHPTKRDIHRALKAHGTEYFAVIEEEIDIATEKGWNENPFFLNCVEMKNIALGDKNQFWTDTDVVLTASKVSRHHHDTTLQRLGGGKGYSVETSVYRIAVGGDLELYLLGRLDWSKFVTKCAQAFQIQTMNEMFAQVFGENSKVGIPEAFIGSGKLSASIKSDFDRKLEYVSAVNGNVPVILMGTKTALGQLTNLQDINWISDSQKEDMARMGRIGYYGENMLLEVPQRIDPSEDFSGKTLKTLVPDNKILILTSTDDKFVKFVDEGETEIDQVTEGGEGSGRYDDTIKYEVTRAFGIRTQLGRYHGEWDLAS